MSFDENVKKTGNLAKAIAIGFGILILTSFVAVYGMNTFVSNPNYEDYCPNVYQYTTEASCIGAGGEWETYPIKEDVSIVREGNCVSPKACYLEYDSKMKEVSLIVFFISIPLGLLILVLGAFIFSLNSVGVGMMLGGIYTLIYGASRYWNYGENWARFLISLIGLVALIIIAYRYHKKK